MNTNKSNNESRLLIQNQYFLNENSLIQYIEWDALARISFVNCNFEKVHLLGKVFGSCSFQNCTFNHFNARKGKFSSCHFDSCKLETTRFFKSNLNFILVENVKVWKLKEWVEIEDFSSFQKHLDE